jgi:hypothetical protein
MRGIKKGVNALPESPRKESRLTLEIQHFKGCPHLDSARDLIREILTGIGLDSGDASILEVEVHDEVSARTAGFLGSPSILVNRRDVEDKTALIPRHACRFYGKSSLPPVWLVQSAIIRALNPAQLLIHEPDSPLGLGVLAAGIALSLISGKTTLTLIGSEKHLNDSQTLRMVSEVLAEKKYSFPGHLLLRKEKHLMSDPLSGCHLFLEEPGMDELASDLKPPGHIRLVWPLFSEVTADSGSCCKEVILRNIRDELEKRFAHLFSVRPTRRARVKPDRFGRFLKTDSDNL